MGIHHQDCYPVLAVKQVQNIQDSLDKVDPKDAGYYNQNAQNFIAQFNELNNAISGNLTSFNCVRDFRRRTWPCLGF